VAKLILMKKNEVSVPEEKKGKQIAVKEANIISLNSFYVQNYQPPVESVEPVQDEIQAAPMEEINPEPIIEQPTLDNNIINVEPSMEIVEEPLIQEEPVNAIEPQQESVIESPVIDLAVDNQVEDTKMDEEMDPELQEIKERLDKVIIDLNNYKKKIKILENEVNQNLEKSKEVLKDTQAAAEIMSIQQARQRQISEEVGASNPAEDETSRLLQKETA